MSVSMTKDTASVAIKAIVNGKQCILHYLVRNSGTIVPARRAL